MHLLSVRLPIGSGRMHHLLMRGSSDWLRRQFQRRGDLIPSTGIRQTGQFHVAVHRMARVPVSHLVSLRSLAEVENS